MRPLLFVGVALLGGAVGSAGTVWLTSAREAQKPRGPVTQAQERIASLASDQARYAARLAALEAAARQPREGPSAPVPPPAPTPAESEPAPERETPLEQQFEQENVLAAYAAERVDPAWARATSAVLERALSDLQAPGDMRVTEVTCRSQTCLARLSWPSKTAAFQAQMKVITDLATGLPCVRHLYLGDEGQQRDAFEGALRLDCSPQP